MELEAKPFKRIASTSKHVGKLTIKANSEEDAQALAEFANYLMDLAPYGKTLRAMVALAQSFEATKGPYPRRRRR